MSELKFKLKKIYIPFILLSLGLFVICIILRWLLDFKLGILNISENLTEFWIPFLLPHIPVSLWFNRKAKLLKFKNYNRYLNYLGFSGMLIAAPIIFSQKQIKEVVFRIIEIETPNEVQKYPNERFFKIENFSVIKNNECETSFIQSYNPKTRGGAYAYAHLMYANKFENSESIWYGTYFEKSLNNISENKAQEIEKNKFYEKSRVKFRNYNFQNVKYFEKKSNDTDKTPYLDAIENCSEEVIKKEQIILEPRNKNIEINGMKLLKKYSIYYLIIFSVFYLMTMNKDINHLKTEIKH